MNKESLHLTQEQRLQQRLSPQQVQFVRLLGMNRTEMEDEVRHEVLDNPAIEIADSDDSSDGEVPAEEMTTDNNVTPDSADPEDEPEDDVPAYRLNISNRSADDKVYEPIITNESTLIDYLSEQISEHDLSEKQQTIADYIIGNIDDNGYLTRSVEAISDDIVFQMGIEVDEDEIQSVLQMIRDLDPAGIGAKDLRDCLLLQLERLPGSDDNLLAYKIIDCYFPEFSKKHYDRIITALKTDKEGFRRALEVILSLNPKPGSLYGGGDNSKAQHIIPDFSVEVDGDNITLTLLNNIPELQIEESFQAMYDDISVKRVRNRSEEEANRFVKDKYESAATFIKMLKQRQVTLFSIMRAILERQKQFFLTEDESLLRPMVLKDIASDTGYDLSVVSRATSGKYVMTQGGIYPLKFFFNEGIRHESGEDVSSREIQSALKEIIEGEDKKKPYSDEVLCTLLNKRGYEIARRTIAKYRERMGFPVARLRKEL
ncbi:MAG: RNA polymerase factor sigma-54 [bacterium]|nr:RNA polymerase factor sigma-54 [bacterium]MDY5827203.1 RNA polymerase factor sigma-54 [Candidatus Limisoma sp.]